MKCSICEKQTVHSMVYQWIRISNVGTKKQECAGFVNFALCDDCISKAYINQAPTNFWGNKTTKKREKEIKAMKIANTFFDFQQICLIFHSVIHELEEIPYKWIIIDYVKLRGAKSVLAQNFNVKSFFLNIIENVDFDREPFSSIPAKERANITATRNIFIKNELYKQFDDKGVFFYDATTFEDDVFKEFQTQLIRMMLEDELQKG